MKTAMLGSLACAVPSSASVTLLAGRPGRDTHGNAKRRRILEFIQTYCVNFGYSPTLREISDAVGLASVNTAWRHVKRLEAQGCISSAVGQPRSIRVVDCDVTRPIPVSQKDTSDLVKLKRRLVDLEEQNKALTHCLKLTSGFLEEFPVVPRDKAISASRVLKKIIDNKEALCRTH